MKCRWFSWPFWALAAAGFALSLPYLDTCGDDAFIYFRMVVNFLRTGQLAYNPGEPCYAMTSATFFFTLAGLVKVLGLTGGRYAISLLGHALAAALLFGLGRRLVRDRRVLLVALAAILFDPFYLRWFWAGWEMSFKIAVAAGALWTLLAAGERGGARWGFGAGLVAGIAFLTRPEMMYLAGLGGVYLAVRRLPGRISSSVPTLLAYGAGLALVAGPWLAFAHSYFGWALPHTIYAKAGGFASWNYLRQYLPKFLQIFFIPALPFYAWATASALGVRPLSAWRRAASAGTLPDLRDWGLVALWAATVAGYLVRGVYIDGIKVGLFSPFAILALAAVGDAARQLRNRVWKRRTVWAWLLALGLLSVGLQARLFYRYSSWNPRYAQGDDARFIDFAKRVKALTPPDARIGIAELGVVGYYSSRYMIDFVGLSTPEIVAYQLETGNRAEAVARYYERHGGPPSHVVHEFPFSPECAPPEYDFWGYRYRLLDTERVRRISGRAKSGEYSIYALYERAP